MEKPIPRSDIPHLIAAINPDLYCQSTVRKKVKRLLKAALRDGNARAFLDAAAIAEPVESSAADLRDLTVLDPFSGKILETPVERRTLILDSMEEPVEAIYFNLLDAIQRQTGWTVEKLEDSMTATAASSVNTDFTQNRIHAQRQAMELLQSLHGLANQILQDLTELRSDRRPDDSSSKEIHQDDRIRKIHEAQLKSRLNQLKLYARWLRPWLSTAEELSPHGFGQGTLANAFNSAQMRILLLATKPLSIDDEVAHGQLPRSFLRARTRDHFSILIVELNIRAAPDRQPSGAHRYRGRTEIHFHTYALTAEELTRLKSELDRQAISETLTAIGSPSEAIDQLVEATEALFAPGRDTTPPQPRPDDSNPFSALWALLNGLIQPRSPSGLAPDSPKETILRASALIHARLTLNRTTTTLNRTMASKTNLNSTIA